MKNYTFLFVISFLSTQASLKAMDRQITIQNKSDKAVAVKILEYRGNKSRDFAKFTVDPKDVHSIAASKFNFKTKAYFALIGKSTTEQITKPETIVFE